MSVEKLKIFKKVKGADNYTKNPIIDSLIRQKLQSEMIVIKDQFHQIISKEQNLQKQPKQQVSMRRKMSTHNLGSISSSKIRESLNYKHSYERSALQFIIQRQKASPFFTIQDIEANNIGRTNFNEFVNKLNSSDILTYPSHPGSTNHLKTILPLDIWLNQLPEVEQIIRKRAEQLQKDHSNPNVYPFKFNYNNRPGTQILQPIKSRLSTSHKSLEKYMELQPNEITYEHRRYHKNDYKGLESWLQNMNEGMNKKFGNGGQQEMKQHLNQTYKVYLSAIKELIRLTYIESAEKGLLLEKIMWSFIRLFQELISEQHRLNYEEFKLYRDETKDLQKDFSQRKGYLEKEVEKYKKTVNQLVQRKRNIYLSYLSYKKVNQEMNREIQKLVGEIKLLNSQNNFLISNLSKIIQEFQSRDIINTKKEDQFTVYYYLNSQDQIQVVAKTPNKQLLDQYFQSSMTSFNLDIINKQQKHDQRIDQLDNQLIAYWDKKRAYLDLDQIIDKNNQPEIADAFVQADGRGPNIYQQVATQFPDQNELNFEDFLREEMQLERKGWQQKQEEYKSTTFELRQIYSQAQEQIQLLTDKNKKLKQSIIEKDRELNYIGRQLQQFDQQIPLLNQKIFMLQQQIISYTQNQRIISQQSAKIQQFLQLQTNKYIQEKQNNSLLAANIFHLKAKVEKLEVLSTSLQDKIKLLAPHLQRMMALAEQSQSEVLIKLSALVQQHLKDYVEKDSKVFLTY